MKDNKTPEKEPETALELQVEAPVQPSREHIDAIIRNRVHSSLAIALIPVPVFDMAALAALHTEMIYKLAKAYNIPFSAAWGRQITAALAGGILPTLITPKLSNWLRVIPIIGPGLGLATLPLANAAATYAVGRAFADHFATGEGLCKGSMDKIGQKIKDGYADSREAVKGWFGKSGEPVEPVEAPAS